MNDFWKVVFVILLLSLIQEYATEGGPVTLIETVMLCCLFHISIDQHNAKNKESEK
jgi:hypothetical protein